MKRTTYIMIGVFVAGWILLVGGILWIINSGEMPTDSSVRFSGKQISRDLPPFKVVTFSQIDNYKQEYWKGIRACTQVTASANQQNVFSYPEEISSYMEVRVESDTLKIDFSFPEANVEKDGETKHSSDLRVMAGDWKLVIAQPVEKIDNRIMGMDINLRRVVQDSLNLLAGQRAYTYVDSCCITSLRIGAAREIGQSLLIKHSEIKDLYIDLDAVWRWEIDAQTCNIDTEYLTGSKSANVILGKGECRRMIWIPKKDDTILEVKLTEKSCITLQK